ncbi:PepSY-associated TM helix domain-containing protein [Paraglaciecola aquimarina]|uniref:PepSY-associated TM helix domain-containing protein n=1 Tax=Paraglaciecola aquimarina TaxID=1235557 RepID=A0ABU3SZ89_9ALTE|nr:PepSY-associated TM helix domain-containing protein [Paraglaciecola aquimarina]MDU0355329.1 PepSY-associated TM helix domain-containing protein [Paraglaciecola aquimarina]
MKLALGSARQWHWISAAICIVGMLFFSWTGITLNHAADIPAKSDITTIEADLPAALLTAWQTTDKTEAMLPPNIRQYLSAEYQLHIAASLVGELSDGEFYLPMVNPGVDAWLSIDIESGELIYEKTDRGWISFFNDLHKGRYTNTAWVWFIDGFAVCSVIFCLSGLWLLYKQAAFRLSTWPIVALGVLLPLVIILLSLH